MEWYGWFMLGVLLGSTITFLFAAWIRRKLWLENIYLNSEVDRLKERIFQIGERARDRVQG